MRVEYGLNGGRPYMALPQAIGAQIGICDPPSSSSSSSSSAAQQLLLGGGDFSGGRGGASVSGSEIDAMTPSELMQTVQRTSVFFRTTPRHKQARPPY